MKKIAFTSLLSALTVLACAPTPDDGTLPGSSTSSGGASSSSSGGACAPVMCALYCENGFQRDSQGCAACSCDPGSSSSSSSSSGGVCPAVACNAYCPFGFAADAHGCPSCTCLPGSCGSITDPDTCHGTAGCEAVFFSDDNADRPAEPVPANDGFQCCTRAADGVYCDVVPPTGCTTDSECGPGMMCQVYDCASRCAGSTDGTRCSSDCASGGQCVPVDPCFGAWMDAAGTCRGPADGALPQECCGVPPPACSSDADCGPGLMCQLYDCATRCGDGSDGTRCESDCVGGGVCVPVDPCWGAWTDAAGTCRGPADGVLPQECCGVPPPACSSDADCRPGEACAMPACETACDSTDVPCMVACAGVCVPVDPCFGAWTDATGTCRGPADGVLPQECCVPPPASCWSTADCREGQTCELPNCTCPEGATCLVACQGVCVDAPTACAAVRCESGTTCVECGPNEDCLAKCVPATEDCRTLGCGEGLACQEVTECSGSGCACPAGDSTCECPPPADPVCTTWFTCQPQQNDPCARLTEDQCSQDNDLCEPAYAESCPACQDQGCLAPCTREYVGCKSL